MSKKREICAVEANDDLFERLKNIKENDKHVAIVEALVYEELLFVEIDVMAYKITNSAFDSAILFVRTKKVMLSSGKSNVVKDGSFRELATILKEGC